MIPAQTVIYASDDSELSVKEAREYIKSNGLTKDDVRLIKKEDMVLVISKMELWV